MFTFLIEDICRHQRETHSNVNHTLEATSSTSETSEGCTEEFKPQAAAREDGDKKKEDVYTAGARC